MTQATAILRQIGAEAKPRLRSVRDWLTCVLVEDKGPIPAAPLGPSLAHLNLPPGIPIPGITHPIGAGALTTPPCLDPDPTTQPPTRIPTPDASWKPWVEPFQPSRPPGSNSTSTSSPVLPHASTSPAKPAEEIFAPAPRLAPGSIESWRATAQPYAYGRPTPPPFNYAATYEHSWPLPSESAAARAGGGLGAAFSSWNSPRHIPTTALIPMKRAASGPVPESVTRGMGSSFRPSHFQSPTASRDPSPHRPDGIPAPLSSSLAY
jgi:hypothetical protein